MLVTKSVTKSTMAFVFCLFILNASLIRFAATFPSGAPTDACDALLPRHPGTYASFDNNPYFVTASSDSYGDDDGYEMSAAPVKVDIGGAPFKGFLITAIDTLTGERVGSFATVKGSSVLPCSAITHTDNKLKKSASFLWNPPKAKKGRVTFIATIVHSYSQYYPGLIAQVVRNEYATANNLYPLQMPNHHQHPYQYQY